MKFGEDPAMDVLLIVNAIVGTVLCVLVFWGVVLSFI